ncbi:MAG: hypothetical protein ABIO44_00735, partial [Saprospiraceae bacterium]
MKTIANLINFLGQHFLKIGIAVIVLLLVGAYKSVSKHNTNSDVKDSIKKDSSINIEKLKDLTKWNEGYPIIIKPNSKCYTKDTSILASENYQKTRQNNSENNPEVSFELWEQQNNSGIVYGPVNDTMPVRPPIPLPKPLLCPGSIQTDIYFKFNSSFELNSISNELDNYIKNRSKSSLPIKLKTNSKPVKVVIVDSGIDSSIIGKNSLTKYNCKYLKNFLSNFGKNKNEFGISIPKSIYNLEPNDELGHGTSINSIIIGYSRPCFEVKNASQNFQIENVNIYDTVTKG